MNHHWMTWIGPEGQWWKTKEDYFMFYNGPNGARSWRCWSKQDICNQFIHSSEIDISSITNSALLSQLSIPTTIWHTHPQPAKKRLGNYKVHVTVHFNPSLISNLPKRFIRLQQLCKKFFNKFVTLTNREFVLTETAFKTTNFQPTDKVDN